MGDPQSCKELQTALPYWGMSGTISQEHMYHANKLKFILEAVDSFLYLAISSGVLSHKGGKIIRLLSSLSSLSSLFCFQLSVIFGEKIGFLNELKRYYMKIILNVHYSLYTFYKFFA